MTTPLLTLLLSLAALNAAWAQSSQPPAPQAPPAAAPAEPEFPIVRVGTTTYLQYLAELENRAGLNVFDVTRGYINVTGQLSRNVRFRLTPDIRRITDGSLAGSLAFRIKYAFLQYDNLLPGSAVRFGAHATPWIDFEQTIMRYRVQGTVFSEREGMIPGSADFGASYQMSLPANFGEFHAGIFNGEGSSSTDPNKYKSVQARFTVRLLPGRGLANGLRMSGFITRGWYAADRPRHVNILMGSFEHPHLVVAVQGVKAIDSPAATLPRDIDRSGSSVFLEVREGTEGWAGLARVDLFDPDDSIGGNSQRRTIAGRAYWWAWGRGRLGLVATNEQVHYDAPARPKDNRMLVQTHIEF